MRSSFGSGAEVDRRADADVQSMIATDENRIRKLEAEKLLLAEKIAGGGRPLRHFDDALRTAFDFLENPWKLWASERFEDKRTVSKLAFADRLAYRRKNGFRTPIYRCRSSTWREFQWGKWRWCARLGSNQQPLPSEGSTLSIELRTRRLRFYQRGF